MKKIAVLTRDEFLYKKIALSLEGCNTVMLGSGDDAHGFDRVFLDLDTCEAASVGKVTMSRRGNCDLPIPFDIDAPARYLSEKASARLISRHPFITLKSSRKQESRHTTFLQTLMKQQWKFFPVRFSATALK